MIRQRNLSFEKIQEHLKTAFEYTAQASGITLHISRLNQQPHKNSHTFFIGYEGPLPGATGKEVKVDITIREQIVFPFEMKPILKAYPEYEDLPEGVIIGAYSLNEITAEKIVACLDLARNEPRDLYDLWYLTTNDLVNLADLADAIRQKMTFQGKDLSNVREDFTRKEARLKKLWMVRLASQMTELPEFDQVYREVLRELRRAGFPK